MSSATTIAIRASIPALCNPLSPVRADLGRELHPPVNSSGVGTNFPARDMGKFLIILSDILARNPWIKDILNESEVSNSGKK